MKHILTLLTALLLAPLAALHAAGSAGHSRLAQWCRTQRSTSNELTDQASLIP